MHATFPVAVAVGESLWRVELNRLPVRVNGPNLSRPEVPRIARLCFERDHSSLD